MTDRNQPNEETGPQPGPRLGRALAGLRKESVFISPVVDEKVLGQAKPHLARIRTRRSRRERVGWVALAAGVALAAMVARTVLHQGGSPQFAREDLNHDGKVDILDAFQLAREIKSGKPPAQIEDFNGDGKVDAADVEILAKRAVSLDKGGHS